jgi:parallel beta-helix repeat protein
MKMKTYVKILLIALGCSLCAAGSLQPSAPPASTMKTLNQIEPRIPIPAGTGMVTYTISVPGSYYLEGNRSAVGTGIIVSASNVTIDLMGYTLEGTLSGSSRGISISSDCNNIEIRNGTISKFNAYGIVAETSTVSGIRLIKIRSMQNGGIGANLAGYGNTVQDCTFNNNKNAGVYLNGGQIINCVSYHNQNAGIYTGSGALVTNCTAHNNSGQGISTSWGCTISNCTAYANSASGISTNSGCTIINCTSHSNGTDGIYAGTGCLIHNVVAYDNTYYGIYAHSESTISNCNIYSNLTGINAGIRSTILNCTVVRNDDDGIYLRGNSCMVKENNCSYNGQTVADGAGIKQVDDYSYTEANVVNNNDYGILVSGTGNVIVKNSASGNTTNYSIVAGNKTGTISTNPTTAGIWDNFSF